MSREETMKVVELVRRGLISTNDARRLLGFVDEVTPPVLTTNHTNFLGESYVPAWPSDWSLTLETVTNTTVPGEMEEAFAKSAGATWKEDFWDKFWDHKPPPKPPKPDPEPDILPLHAKRKITLEK